MNKARIPNKVGTIFGSYNPLTCSSLNKNMTKQLRDKNGRFTGSEILTQKEINKIEQSEKKFGQYSNLILDGRTKIGRPVKKVAKVLDFLAYLISCAAVSTLIIYTIFQ